MKKAILSAFMLLPATAAQAQTFSADELSRGTIKSRAVEAVIWGMPAVNFDLMYQAMVRETKGTYNQIVYWSRLPDWKNQTLTPNPDSIYLMPFINTKSAGPVVIEIPPADEGSINGTIMDAWQMPLEDVGPAGVDKGAGGKYLVLPPGYKDKAPDGYIALPSATYQGYALLRSILKSGSDADIAKAARVRPAYQGLSLVAGGEPCADQICRRNRRHLRRDDSLRLAILPIARPLCASRTVADPRQDNDRSVEVDRNRKGQAVQSGSGDAGDPERGRPRGPCLVRKQV
jgi:hypothetical protein